MSALPMPRYEETFGIARGIEGRPGAARRVFIERLERGLVDARSGGHRLALFLVGIDRSGVLASLEPEAAESLIGRVGGRLARCADADAEATRLGDEQFALLLPRFRSGSQVRDVASRMLGMMRIPFQASIGIAVFPTDAVQPAILIGCAAAALANARREGKHSYSFYLPFFAATAADAASRS